MVPYPSATMTDPWRFQASQVSGKVPKQFLLLRITGCVVHCLGVLFPILRSEEVPRTQMDENYIGATFSSRFWWGQSCNTFDTSQHEPTRQHEPRVNEPTTTRQPPTQRQQQRLVVRLRLTTTTTTTTPVDQTHGHRASNVEPSGPNTRPPCHRQTCKHSLALNKSPDNGATGPVRCETRQLQNKIF